jgi:hypothetical protein
MQIVKLIKKFWSENVFQQMIRRFDKSELLSQSHLLYEIKWLINLLTPIKNPEVGKRDKREKNLNSKLKAKIN